MSEYSEIISLQFNHKPELIPQTVKGLIATIQFRSLTKDLSDQKTLRIGWILTELLTNAVKHVKTQSSTISIYESASRLLIRKTDYGTPLPFLQENENTNTGSQVVIYQNGSEVLTGHITGNKIEFMVEESTEPLAEDLLSQISEHFGLMIISKSCETFQYDYNASEKKNIFSCTILMKQE